MISSYHTRASVVAYGSSPQTYQLFKESQEHDRSALKVFACAFQLLVHGGYCSTCGEALILSEETIPRRNKTGASTDLMTWTTSEKSRNVDPAVYSKEELAALWDHTGQKCMGPCFECYADVRAPLSLACSPC